ncbi:MCFD2 family protein [Megaselia abdita]
MYLQSFLLLLVASPLLGQRVAPGVPPQHYQQPQHGQYQQPQVPQQQYHQQQVPQHGQQPPPQQHQQQQVYQQQPPPAQGHHQPQAGQHQPVQPQQHHQPHHPHPQQVLNAQNIQQEREHIQEHMEVPIDTSKMSEAELQFHYFKMHDSDNNNKLDGCELIKSLIHWHEQGSKEHHEGKPHVEEKVFSDEELVALIDPILKMDDTSRDGFIDYPEFIKAQQKASAANQNQQQQNQQTQQLKH